MCLTLIKKFKTREEAKEASKNPRIATRDKIVYKSLYKCSDNTKGRTPYRGFSMTMGDHFYQTGKPFGFLISPSWGLYKLSINKGLHACTSYTEAKNRDGDLVVQMIIPKGSKYFLGDNGDIVADNLIWPWKN